MKRLVVALDALAALRELASCAEFDLVAAIVLAQLAGADAVRLGVGEDLRTTRESDLHDARRAAHALELKMAPSQTLLKLALEIRPQRVVLAAEMRDGSPSFGPLDLRGAASGTAPILRALADAGIPAVAVIPAELNAVKAAHTAGLAAVEFYTGHAADLPAPARARALESLRDAARLASKLRMATGVGGGLGPGNVGEFVAGVPGAAWVAVGRTLLARALLVGLDRAVRDLLARVP